MASSVVRTALPASSALAAMIDRVLVVVSLALTIAAPASGQTPIACGQTLAGSIAAAAQ